MDLNVHVEMIYKAFKACCDILSARGPQRQYQDQMDQVKTGRRVTELHPVNSHPEPAAAPVKPVQKVSLLTALRAFSLGYKKKITHSAELYVNNLG